MGKPKVYCAVCAKRCKGEVLKVQEQFVHKSCFKCAECQRGLETGGFFVRDKKHFCPEDYQKLYGVKCRICGKFVEGEVVTALGSTFHPSCFKCSSCSTNFAPGDRVTLWSGNQHLCSTCSGARQEKENLSPVSSKSPADEGGGTHHPRSRIVNGAAGQQQQHQPQQNGDGEVVEEPQISRYQQPVHAAPPPQRHRVMNGVAPNGDTIDGGYITSGLGMDDKSKNLNALYISTDQEDDRCPSSYSSGSMGTSTPRHRDGREPRFHASFGQHLNQSYISIEERAGSVAGSTSSRSGFRRQHSPASVYPPKSPHFHRPEKIHHSHGHGHGHGHGHVEPRKAMSVPGSTSSMRKGMQALAEYCRRGGTSISGASSTGRRTPASISPSASMDPCDDPVLQSMYPGASKPQSGRVTAIERDDWPGPAFTGVVLAEIMREKRRSQGEDSLDSMSTTSKSMASSLDSRMESEIASICNSERSGMCQEQTVVKEQDDSAFLSPSADSGLHESSKQPQVFTFSEVSEVEDQIETPPQEAQLREQRPKASSTPTQTKSLTLPAANTSSTRGMHSFSEALLKDFEDARKRRSRSPELDPWLASRTPSANKHLPLKTRYNAPYGMSPSRDIRRDRHERHPLTHQLSYPSVGNRSATLPYGYPASCTSSPRPGYTQGYMQTSMNAHHPGKASSLPPSAYGRTRSVDLHGRISPFTMSQCSVDLDRSAMESTELDTVSGLTAVTSSAITGATTSSRRQRRYRELSLEDLSYPNVLGLHKTTSLLHKPEKAPPKIYEYDQLKVTNFQLPKDVDRNKLEKHLSLDQFRKLFKMEPAKFGRLPEWKQNDLKKKLELF